MEVGSNLMVIEFRKEVRKMTLKKKIIAGGVLSGVAWFSLLASALAAPPEMTDGFVCPVIKTENVLNSPKGGELAGGHYTIGGPDVMVPLHATNMDGDGTPGGDHASPGGTDYTAVWAGQ